MRDVGRHDLHHQGEADGGCSVGRSLRGGDHGLSRAGDAGGGQDPLRLEFVIDSAALDRERARGQGRGRFGGGCVERRAKAHQGLDRLECPPRIFEHGVADVLQMLAGLGAGQGRQHEEAVGVFAGHRFEVREQLAEDFLVAGDVGDEADRRAVAAAAEQVLEHRPDQVRVRDDLRGHIDWISCGGERQQRLDRGLRSRRQFGHDQADFLGLVGHQDADPAGDGDEAYLVVGGQTLERAGVRDVHQLVDGIGAVDMALAQDRVEDLVGARQAGGVRCGGLGAGF